MITDSKKDTMANTSKNYLSNKNSQSGKSSKPQGSTMPPVGKPAPDFSLPDMDGKMISLKSFRGKKVVLYFYPKDDTPGCTIEAKGFSDDASQYTSKDAVIIGVSMDTCESHKRFYQKHGLDIILLSDVEGTIVQRYGCWVEKNLYGKKYKGILRATFLIDQNGFITDIFSKVTPNEHSQEVLQAISRMK